jgi:transposase
VCLVGIEGTGSYGAGLARYVSTAGVRVVEVDRCDRQDRRRQGKSDPLDAVSAARAVQSGRAAGAPKGRDGAVEAIRALMVAKRSAAAERTQTINQARALVLTGPDDLRARFTGHTVAALVAELASLRPRPGSTVGYATRIALRELGRRAEFLDAQLGRLDELIGPLVTDHAPGLLALYGIGPNTAALLLIAAGDHPGRLRSEAAWAHLCGAAPIPASRARPSATGSTPAATARPTMRCGGSCSPAWAPTRPPAPTPNAAPPKESPKRRSSAVSSATSPARSTPTSARLRADAHSPGTAWPNIRLPCLLACERSAGRPRVRPGLLRRDLIRACPPPRAAPPCLVRNPADSPNLIGFSTQEIRPKMSDEPLTRHIRRTLDKT